MLPIGDDNSSRRIVPLVTYALLVLNILFYFVELSGGDAFVMKWAFVPSRFLCQPFWRFFNALHIHVHAWWLAAPGKQHALFMDLR